MIISALAIVLFGLGAAVCWGIADFWAAKAAQRLGAEASVIWVSIIATVTYALFYTFTPSSSAWTSIGVAYAILAGIFLQMGLYAFFRGLETGPVSLVSPISSAYPLITTLVLLLFFKASLSLRTIGSIIVIVLGVMLTSGLLDTKKVERKLSAGLIFACLAVLLWGAAYALLGQAINALGWQKAILVDMLAGFIPLFLLFAITKREVLKKSLHLGQLKNPFVIGTALIQLLGGCYFSNRY